MEIVISIAVNIFVTAVFLWIGMKLTGVDGKFLAMLTVLFVPVLLGAPWVIGLSFGAEYEESAPLFVVLLLGTLVAIQSAPAGAVLYGAGKAQMIALFEGMKLFLFVGLAFCFLPRYGTIGMAWAVSMAKGVIGILTFLTALRLSRHSDPSR